MPTPWCDPPAARTNNALSQPASAARNASRYARTPSYGRPLCVECCPTEALALPQGAEPETTILGKAVVIEDWCLAYRLTGCRYCYDVCPYEAIELDADNRPHVIADKCNGCGACESVCVSLQNGSISSGATSRAIVVVPDTEA